jgi:hypothetical protein
MKRSARNWYFNALLITGALVPPAAGLVHQARAQDSQSAVGFLISEASRQAPQQPSTRVVPLLLNEGRYSPERQRAVTALKKMPVAKTRFVRLLEPDEGKAKVPPQSKPVREPILDAADAVKAVLSDPTLRPGDIVMFPDGPKVFAGTTGSSHKLSSFQDIGASRLVSKSTRSIVTALAPKAPATRVGQELRLLQVTKASAGQQADSPRVVYQDALVSRR